MTDLRTAAQQALDSINELFAAEQSEGGERGGHIRTPATREHLVRVAQARKALHESCGALRAALAQAEPVQEPVAWRCACGANLYIDEYGHPASRAVPVSYGQTLEEAMRETREKAQAYEAGWKAGLAHQAEPVEPVAWNWMLDGQPYGQAYYGRPPDADIVETSRLREDRTVRLLYTAPPQRKPLPNHDQHCVDVPGYGLMAVRLVRVVERAHGIKE